MFGLSLFNTVLQFCSVYIGYLYILMDLRIFTLVASCRHHKAQIWSCLKPHCSIFVLVFFADLLFSTCVTKLFGWCLNHLGENSSLITCKILLDQISMIITATHPTFAPNLLKSMLKWLTWRAIYQQEPNLDERFLFAPVYSFMNRHKTRTRTLQDLSLFVPFHEWVNRSRKFHFSVFPGSDGGLFF